MTGLAYLALWLHGLVCGIIGTWTTIDRLAARNQPEERE